MKGKSVLAAVLVACTAGAFVMSLWNRDNAILILALSSLATLRYIFPPMAKRAMLGMIASAIGVGLGVGLPGLGDAIDGIALLIGLVATLISLFLRAQKWVNFLIRLPLGAACLGLYWILWSASRSLPRGYSLAGAQHAIWFDIVAALLAALAGIVFLLIVAWIYSWFGRPAASTIFFTVGYPWYLMLFTLTFFIPGAEDSHADS